MQPNFTRKKIGIFLLTPTLLLLSCFFTGKLNAQCTWTSSVVYPIPIQDHSMAGVGTNIYSFGGYTNAVATTNSYRFDGTSWTPIAPLPLALIAGGAVTDGTNIYIIGGFSGAAQPVLYRYNVATNTYTTLAPAPNATISHAVAIANGKIYKVAGAVDGLGTATAVVNIYDIATNTWTTGAPYPAATTWAKGYAQGNFVYVGGGIAGTPSLKAYRYDVIANTWNDAAMADLPQTRWGAGSDFYDNGFIMAGGVVNGNAVANISNTVISYDIAGNSWSNLPNMVGERYRLAAGVFTTGLHAVGGVSQTSVAFSGTNINQRLNCIALLPCTGTPVPGNTLSSANPVCPTVNFTLSTQTPPASGLSFEWQSSPDNVTWTTIPGATGSTYATSLTASTWYRANVTCGINTATSVPLRVLLAPVTSCYCAAGSPDVTFEKISNVTYGTINQNSTGQVPYTNFTAVSTTMVHGQTAPISVGISGGFASDQVRVWIDFNQDGDFVDAGELVLTTGVGGGPLTGNITISPTATVGPTRMRVRLYDSDPFIGDPNPGPCGNTAYGEVEDYTVNIQPCIQGVVTTHPSDASIQCSNNTSFAVVVAGSALTYGWEYRVNASSPWQTVTNAGIYSGATTPTLTLTNVPATMAGYQYRALFQGPCTAIDFSTTATLTVTPLVATVTPISATICTGSIQQLTLTNASSPSTVTFSSGTVNLSIPDFNPAGILSAPIVVSGIPAGAIVSDISIVFNMTHTYVGDMDINVIAPNAGNLNLVGGLNGGSGTNATANFVNTVVSSNGTVAMSGFAAPRTGIFAADARAGFGPSGNLQNTATWAGLTGTLNGNWRLAMADFGPADLGVLQNWTISITYGAPAAGIWTSSPAAPNTMFTDPVATVPYTGTPATTIYVRPTVNTSYSVVYSTTTPCVSAPTVIPVNVVNPVSAVVNPSNAAACVGNNATFTVSAGGGPLTYQWQVSTDAGANWSNISGATSSSYTVTGVTSTMNNNRYRAVISAAPCAGSTNSGAAILTVNPLPTVTLSAPDLLLAPGQTTTITASSSPAARPLNPYSWTLNGAPLAGTTNTQSVRIDGLGLYQATVTDINGCVNTSNILTIGAEPSDRLWIYPNPSPGVFQVRLYYGGTVTERRIVSIFNSAGQLVMNKEFTLGDNFASPYLMMEFDLSHLSAGAYVVKVNNTHTDQTVSGLVMIQHD